MAPATGDHDSVPVVPDAVNARFWGAVSATAAGNVTLTQAEVAELVALKAFTAKLLVDPAFNPVNLTDVVRALTLANCLVVVPSDQSTA